MAEATVEGTLVIMKCDITPYMKGDTVRLDKEELKRVDKIAKAREIEAPYTKVATKA